MFSRIAISLLFLTAVAGSAYGQVSNPTYCRATNARYNILSQPKSGYDYIPIVDDDSRGFWVAYSAKQNDTNTDFSSTSCMYVLPLEGDEVLIFGGGFGDTWYLPGGAYFNADYDAAFIHDIVSYCMQRDPTKTRVRFVAPHGHPDHITVAFIKALERVGLTMAEIAFHEADGSWIEQLPWSDHHRLLFNVMRGGTCGQELATYDSPLGHVWVTRRMGHTPGSVDMIVDIDGDPTNRARLLGSQNSPCNGIGGFSLTVGAHGTAVIGGPRRAVTEVIEGTGQNRVSLFSKSPPKLGTDWLASVEVGGHPGATSVLLYGTDFLLMPTIRTAYGELMVSFQGVPLIQITQPVLVGDEVTFKYPLPSDAALMGRTAYVQATIFGGGIEFTNALKLTVGF